jgi:hypothetical protein
LPERQDRTLGLHLALDNDLPSVDPILDPTPDLRQICRVHSERLTMAPTNIAPVKADTVIHHLPIHTALAC